VVLIGESCPSWERDRKESERVGPTELSSSFSVWPARKEEEEEDRKKGKKERRRRRLRPSAD
jgi:hypothetical protein